MIVHVATFLSSMGGSLDKDHYLRELPMRPGWAVYCRKPQYGKKEKKQMAKSGQAQWFAEMMARAKAIYNDPLLRAQYAADHKQALRENSRHAPDKSKGKLRTPALLWEYIRHRVAEDMKKAFVEAK